VAAYVIVDLTVTDPAAFQQYASRIVDVVENCGGKYIVASENIERLEGDWRPQRLVVIQFESITRAKLWLQHDHYGELREIRHRAAKTNMIVVEGAGG
jgi:uncharacterized protein (DUF1330 family)